MNLLVRRVAAVATKLRPSAGVVLATVLAVCVTSTAIVQIAVFERISRIEERVSLVDAALMAQRRAASDKRVSIDGIPLKGNPTAKAIVIQYTDFDCPFCLSFAKDTLPEFVRAYVDSGRVLFGLRHLPLENLHPMALRAAEAAECAGRQAKFWEMHDALFDEPTGRDVRDLLRLSKTIGLNSETFGACLKGAAAVRIKGDIESAKDLRIKGTPAFVFGARQRDGMVKITRIQSGMLRIRTLSNMIDDLLRDVASSGE